MEHRIKIWPEYYADVLNGKKRFEVRKNDRNYSVGDVVYLQEYNDKTKEFTNNEAKVIITFILKGIDGIEDGYCVWGFRVLNELSGSLTAAYWNPIKGTDFK